MNRNNLLEMHSTLILALDGVKAINNEHNLSFLPPYGQDAMRRELNRLEQNIDYVKNMIKRELES